MTQLETIRDIALSSTWLTLADLAARTSFPEASISAQLRHLRKRGFIVEKRQRKLDEGVVWEYHVDGGGDCES
jgi:Fic family protein